MYYFEVMAADDLSPRQLETVTAFGPFVVEAIDERAARRLVGLNYTVAECSGSASAAPLVTVWNDAAACEVTRLPFSPGALQPRQALVAGLDRAGDELAQQTLVVADRVVARMIWWPCAGPDIYPFGDALMFNDLDGENLGRQAATV